MTEVPVLRRVAPGGGSAAAFAAAFGDALARLLLRISVRLLPGLSNRPLPRLLLMSADHLRTLDREGDR
ncbi:cyclodeaminase/cyclohydrolase family protein [Paraburkholderia sp.]|uniref:cyclodeaminase/cyclohydrolase family protein n=1 Tax=Paraburkholderia sp. TaxID=1926495 RepID=UPI003C70F143